jgi:hypothetical protein
LRVPAETMSDASEGPMSREETPIRFREGGLPAGPSEDRIRFSLTHRSYGVIKA